MQKNRSNRKKTIILITVNALMLAAIVIYKKFDCGLKEPTRSRMVNWMA